jgi:LPXTG-site transpeptidase (sortase) family protein
VTWMSRRARWRWVLATAALVAVVGAIAWVLAGNLGGGSPAASEVLAVPTGLPRATAKPTATPEPAITLVPSPIAAPPVRLLIPAIGVDAPVTVKGLRPDAVMDVPDGPEDVAWYNFTARPGMGGNAVLSGHLDYRNYGAAVFWRLKDLREGDIVEVRLADGSLLRYGVSLKLSYDARMAPVPEIVGPTSKEVVTLITCGGIFDDGSRSYSNRLVVRAERI